MLHTQDLEEVVDLAILQHLPSGSFTDTEEFKAKCEDTVSIPTDDDPQTGDIQGLG